MLEIKGLKKSFKAKEVLKNLNLSINEGEIVCLLGNNGAGKTTLINCILRMLQADAGSIFLEGRDISTYKNEEYFSKVNALLESSVNVYDYLTGWQNIEYFSGLQNIDSGNEKIKTYISLFELKEAIHEAVGTYSRGMRQKLALLIALMSSPKLLLLDEPTLGLDIQSKLSVIQTLNTIIKTEKIAVLLTSHQMDVVQKLQSRILILKDGVVHAFDKTDYEDKDLYTVSYIKDSVMESDTIRGSFQDIYQSYYGKYEIMEIRKKERDLEEILLEVFHETD
ncbi:ABC transporter ATP-binding protein [Oribacterium sinus]|jgi:ABC superfamily ATP binding cassette transporter, ABC protein|uniref:ABC transporter, ATP-binding protein n=1 Tax=Oribacterium sinus F0268 TaxID=585501 RepID=C2KUD7_9FIRM|nr:ABC transporter ATP-binding protein [Oribacterium sinus]EEJ52625.1 ABC transporter, ATP-binding protein [Oribacterium sinus F0268]